MATAQLRLVQDAPPTFNLATQDPARRIFEHWLFMFGRSPARCKLGPIRRKAIDSALALGYDVDVLLMAVEGMAADPLDRASAPHIAERMREIDWLMGAEARIEHWAARGEQLRAMADAPPPPAAADVVDAAPVDPAAEAAGRQRFFALAAQLRGAAHG
jgi:hypothetical protein